MNREKRNVVPLWPILSRKAVLQIISSNRLLALLPTSAHEAFAERGTVRVIGASKVLSDEMTTIDAAYIALGDGLAGCLVPNRLAPWRAIPRGTILGLTEVLRNRPRPATVFARSIVSVLEVPGELVRSTFFDHPEVLPYMIECFLDIVDEFRRAHAIALTTTPSERVERLLVAFAGEDGVVQLSVSELAAHAGTTRETASRTISRLVRGGRAERVGSTHVKVRLESVASTRVGDEPLLRLQKQANATKRTHD